jgi:type II secretory pathway pseudopilin PulG
MIPNSKFKIQNSKFNSKGFTLVELLSSIIVLVAVGSVIAGIITSSLRGTNKTTTIENIRQNGNYTLAQMSKNIEYAQVFNGLSNDGVNYVTSCPFSLASTPAAVTTNYNFIKVTPLNSSLITYSCTSSPVSITANSSPLIDTNVVSLISCTLSCVQAKATDIPIIKIGFTLGPRNSNNLVENSTPPILFETSVTIRNYKR